MAETPGDPDHRLPLEEAGLWVQPLADRKWTAGRPALFLDRDGTINVDTGYPKSPQEIVLLSEILPAIRAANAGRLPAIIVSNQSGVARGLFDWHDFAGVNAQVLDLLRAEGCAIDMVIACAYHDAGQAPLGVADHPMRKPNPGMLLRAAAVLGVDLKRSIIVGDKPSDMEAGRRAGLSTGWLIGEQETMAGDFTCRPLREGADYHALENAISALSI